jgi:hypothetical protein
MAAGTLPQESPVGPKEIIVIALVVILAIFMIIASIYINTSEKPGNDQKKDK